jgi:transcriptional regulator with XRE-family HTH domain
MTQAEFAEKVEVSTDYVGMIERGERIPKLETFVKIANALGVSADFLLSDFLEVTDDNNNYALSKKIDQLPAPDRNRIYEVLTLLIKQTEK